MGSSPSAGSLTLDGELKKTSGGLPKRSNGTDCKSVGSCLRRFESSTPHFVFVVSVKPSDDSDVWWNSKIANALVRVFLDFGAKNDGSENQDEKCPRLDVGFDRLIWMFKAKLLLTGGDRVFGYRLAGVAQWQSPSLPSWL